MTVGARVDAVRERIAVAARAAGRDPTEITLVAVTKETDIAAVRAALAAGLRDFGENRAQELVAKAEALGGEGPRWHFIGRLQRNKVHLVAPYVALWESVDRADLAAEIGRRAPGATVLVQVNVAGERQKGGCAPDALRDLVTACREHGCTVNGLMTVPPAAGDPRPVFRTLRRLTDELGLEVCSMGMSGDFEDAIAEGSTMVRVGRAIFGPRPSSEQLRR